MVALLYGLQVLLLSASIASADDSLRYRDKTAVHPANTIRGGQQAKSPLLLKERQCAADCYGFCVPSTSSTCCGVNGYYCNPGEKCCGSDGSCAPSASTCCPGGTHAPAGATCCVGGTYAPAGETCCPDGSHAPAGWFCCPDEGSCRDGGQCLANNHCSPGFGISGGGGITVPTITIPTITIPPAVTTSVLESTWYYFTVTWYYYTWYYSYDFTLDVSEVLSSTVYKTTVLSISTANAAAASEWLSSVTESTSFPTPANATPLPQPTAADATTTSEGFTFPGISTTTALPALATGGGGVTPSAASRVDRARGMGFAFLVVVATVILPGVLMLWL